MRGIEALYRLRNTKRVCLALLLTGRVATTQALTVERSISAAYVKDNPKEFSVKAVEGKDGLLHFTVIRNLTEAKYLVAHLSVSHSGIIVAKSDTPLVGHKDENVFHVSLLRENVQTSELIIGESALTISGETAIGLPGTTDYKIVLQDFVPPAPG